jgi:non-ribosomal peptide synthetase component E (peptide arylation enzyme)
LALGNHPEFLLHFLALNSLGVSIVPLDLGTRDAELRQMIRLADLDLLIAWDRRRRSRGRAVAMRRSDPLLRAAGGG